MPLEVKDWQPSYEDEGLFKLDDDITTSLPIPGEYFVLQLNPVAMCKHLRRPGLSSTLRKTDYRKYLAVVVEYLETLSEKKPWHMAQVLLHYEQLEPLPLDSTGVQPIQHPGEDTSDLMVGKPVTYPQNRTHKKRQMLQVLVVRLRTRLCELPRTDLTEVPAATLEDIARFRRNDNHGETLRPVESAQYFIERASPSPLWSFPDAKVEYDPSEWETGTDLHRLCLLPHCDYSLDLDHEISEGKYLLQEQTQIMALMLASIPEIPSQARIPITYQYLQRSDYTTEIPLPPDLQYQWNVTRANGVPSWVVDRRKRAQQRRDVNALGWLAKFFRTAYDLRDAIPIEGYTTATEEVEIPRERLLLFSPPGVNDIEIDNATKKKLQATKPSPVDMLVEFWLELREAILAWWSPSAVYIGPVDDVPHIPFQDWYRRVAAGDVDPIPPPFKPRDYSYDRNGLPY